jgi:phosphocarrier protein FPr
MFFFFRVFRVFRGENSGSFAASYMPVPKRVNIVVSIVIVSHSAKLAEGVVELARNMGGAEIRIRAAGGLNLPGQPLGTDPLFILEAIEAVYSEEGVLVLMDLGSALLSSEMALEMLPDEKRGQVILCEAPLVEGAVAAAVQARIGSPLAQVVAEARGALISKATQLGLPISEPHSVQTVKADLKGKEPLEIYLSVNIVLGLHARPAARFVKTVGEFEHADIQVKNLTTGRGPVDAKSINAVTTLDAQYNHVLRITASGPEAQAALVAIRALADDHFGDLAAPAFIEKPVAIAPPVEVTPTPGEFNGLPVSPGIAIGPAYLVRREPLVIPENRVDDPQGEWERFSQALEKTGAAIRSVGQAARLGAGAQAAEIFDAHLLFLSDPTLLAPTRSAIFEQRKNAAAAWNAAVQAMAENYRNLETPYLQVRAADVEAVGYQVLLNLSATPAASFQFDEPCILLAEELTPADTARLDPARVLGIGTVLGGPTSHSAILARSLGIPAVAGLGDALMQVAPGTLMAMDGTTGLVLANPAFERAAEFRSHAQAAQAAQSEAWSARGLPAITYDGHRVEIGANIGSARDAQTAVQAGAEGVGLFRTEFLFLDRQMAPDEEEQFQAYRAAAEILDGKPLIIRTLDAGGDKKLPYLDQGVEANPFLGWRAVRLCLDRPDLFKTQLQAIARVAATFPVKVMFPMVATLKEWRSAVRLLAEAQAEVGAPAHIETGIMIEIPSAALCAAHFAAEVDFFSIGTNDLTQYTLAAERGNPRVAALNDALHPAVLNLIQRVVEAAHTRGKWVGVCGELASDPLAIPILVGLGIDELSVSVPSIARVKQAIRSLDFATLRARVPALLALESASAVRAGAAQL